MICLIPSYLGDSQNLNKKRYYRHLEQIEQLLSIPTITKIIIYAQEYSEEQFLKNEKIVYLTGKPVSCANAKNNLLKFC